MPWLNNTTDHSNTTDKNPPLCEENVAIINFWICVIVASFVVGFPGVVAILLDMFQKRRRGTPFTPYDVYILNLTAMDGFFLFFLPLELYGIVSNSDFEAFTYLLYSLALYGRPLFVAFICLDCYLAVVHPLTYKARKSLTPRILVTVGIWAITIVYGYSLIYNHKLAFTGFIQISFFAIILSAIGFCDFSILWTLKRSKPEGRGLHPRKKKALQVVIHNIVITFMSYLPATITYSVSSFLEPTQTLCLAMSVVVCITITGNDISVILHLNNMGKLDWLKYLKKK